MAPDKPFQAEEVIVKFTITFCQWLAAQKKAAAAIELVEGAIKKLPPGK